MGIEKGKKILIIGASGLVGGLIAKFCEEKKISSKSKSIEQVFVTN